MRVIYSEEHRLHFPQAELSGGQFVTPFERPSRVEYVLNRLRERKLTDIVPPDKVDMTPVAALLDPGYLTFLQTAWGDWKAAGMAGEICINTTAFKLGLNASTRSNASSSNSSGETEPAATCCARKVASS